LCVKFLLHSTFQVLFPHPKPLQQRGSLFLFY
jgi:hypothetical protein